MKICVIGSGYVGLVTGACLSDFGNNVVCVDKDKKKLSSLRNNKIDFYELGLEDLVKKNQNAGRLSFTDDLSKSVKSAEIVFIAVGTPPLADGSSDLGNLLKAVSDLAKHLKAKKKFTVIAVKSTVPVGTSEKVEKILLDAGINRKYFSVVSNPEFLREGHAVNDFLHPDRIVVGSNNKNASGIISELYRPLNARLVFMDRRSSEMVKYASNVYLAARISLINEFANICEVVGADIKKVTEGMGHDPRIGRNYLKAGLGYGGSCLPKDVTALTYLAKTNGYQPVMLASISEINQKQREILLEKILNKLNEIKGKTVAVLGLSFKPQTDDLRDAPSLFIIENLIKQGFNVKAYDPLSGNKAKNILKKLTVCKDLYTTITGADITVILTEWNEFREIDLARFKQLANKPIILDGRNIFEPSHMKEKEIEYQGMGI